MSIFLKILQGLFTVTALCSFTNGVAYLFFPVASLAFLGVQPDAYDLVITRYYGACALGWGWLLWLARRSSRHPVLQVAAASILLVLGISAVVGFQAVRSGVFNQAGWLLVITDMTLSVCALLGLVLVSRRGYK